jgi:HD-GYP domain-containing protein (c-di-GMP phosphodiesterase class II)
MQSREAAREPADLVCLRLDAPGKVDLEVCRCLREQHDPALLLASREGGAELALAAQAHGVDDCVRLTPDRRLLLYKVEKLLTRRLLRRELRRTTIRNETLFLNVLSVMAKVSEAKDPFSRFHSENTSALSSSVARSMGLADEEVRRVGVAGILHDIGKMAISDAILNKPGPLDTRERELVQRHPLVASAILEPIEQLQGALGYIKHHHEHYDGTGYPEGLAEEAIPLGARIIHAVEAYDTMTTYRLYSPARTAADALSELKTLSGRQFDPRVVKTLSEVVRERDRASTVAAPPARNLTEVLLDLTRRVSSRPEAGEGGEGNRGR